MSMQDCTLIKDLVLPHQTLRPRLNSSANDLEKCGSEKVTIMTVVLFLKMHINLKFLSQINLDCIVDAVREKGAKFGCNSSKNWILMHTLKNLSIYEYIYIYIKKNAFLIAVWCGVIYPMDNNL